MKTYAIVLLLMLLLISGCLNIAQKTPEIEYYTLEYEPPEIFKAKPLHYILKIEKFTTNPIYESGRIIYSEKAFARNAYNYHKWISKPGELATYFITRDIKHSAHFKGVFAETQGISASHGIQGSVEEFFEKDYADEWKAVIAINIALIARNEPDKGKKILFQKTFRKEVVCSQKNPQGLAEAMSYGMRYISKSIIIEIYENLK